MLSLIDWKTAERDHYWQLETDMVKIGNGVWKIDETGELAHVLEEFVAERIPTNVRSDEATRIPGVIFAD